jgi:hypothetical protein
MVYKLYVSTAATVGLAALDIREDDVITGVALSVSSGAAVEVSFSSSPSLTTNDVSAAIFGSASGSELSSPPMNVVVSAGERIYLHTASTTGDATAYIYTAGKGDSRPATRRR